MAINQPNIGGYNILSTYFGGSTLVNNFIFLFYTQPQAAWIDDTVPTTDLIDIRDYTDYLSLGTIQSFNPGVIVSSTYLGSSNPPKITVSNDVPQVQFPSIFIEFTSTIPDLTNLYGYACVTDFTAPLDSRVVFREMFDTPLSITAGSKRTFIPIFRLGNTTCQLT